ncbi:MAG: hypothetical protein WAO61_10385 [Solirubrobacterales bacterium]
MVNLIVDVDAGPGYGVPLPAKLRAGFVRAPAMVPNVKSRGERTDGVGRVGLSFEHSSAGIRRELVIDRLPMYARKKLRENRRTSRPRRSRPRR